jgi:hypothetical protein
VANYEEWTLPNAFLKRVRDGGTATFQFQFIRAILCVSHASGREASANDRKAKHHSSITKAPRPRLVIESRLQDIGRLNNATGGSDISKEFALGERAIPSQMGRSHNKIGAEDKHSRQRCASRI